MLVIYFNKMVESMEPPEHPDNVTMFDLSIWWAGVGTSLGKFKLSLRQACMASEGFCLFLFVSPDNKADDWGKVFSDIKWQPRI